MLYRGFRIEIESKGSSPSCFAVYEVFRRHWRRIATADARSAAEAWVDERLEAREQLFGTLDEASAGNR